MKKIPEFVRHVEPGAILEIGGRPVSERRPAPPRAVRPAPLPAARAPVRPAAPRRKDRDLAEMRAEAEQTARELRRLRAPAPRTTRAAAQSQVSADAKCVMAQAEEMLRSRQNHQG